MQWYRGGYPNVLMCQSEDHYQCVGGSGPESNISIWHPVLSVPSPRTQEIWEKHSDSSHCGNDFIREGRNIKHSTDWIFSTLSCDKTKSYVFFQPKDKVCPIIFLHELFVSCPAQDEENNISLGCIAWASRRKLNEMWLDNSPRFQGTPRLSGQWSHRVPGGGWEQRERPRGARRVHHHPLHEAQGE